MRLLVLVLELSMATKSRKHHALRCVIQYTTPHCTVPYVVLNCMHGTKVLPTFRFTFIYFNIFSSEFLSCSICEYFNGWIYFCRNQEQVSHLNTVTSYPVL
jgi:hypothetical protein